MSSLTIAVIIPAHNEEKTIGNLIRTVLAQSRPIEQLIVVADSCKDDTARVAREAGATLVLETTYADKAANQNEALKYVTADVIVGFDGDSIPVDECIDLMVKDLECGYDATCSSILPMQETGFFIEARRFAYSLGRMWWRLCQRTVGRLQVLTGASYAFRTDVVRELGGFPGGLISADMDITWKLHEGGYKTWYTANALTLTVDPETWVEYKAQMPRWSAGYFQNVARYKHLMWHWRSLLVVGTAMWDLITLWGWYAVVTYFVVTGQHTGMFHYMGYWFIFHTFLTTFLVSRVVGWKKAALGFLPYTTLNFYNKYLYTKSMIREWVLGKHYTSWTGRSGRPVTITPMTRARRVGLATISSVMAASFVVSWRLIGHTWQLYVALLMSSIAVGLLSSLSKTHGKHRAGAGNDATHVAEVTQELPIIYHGDNEVTASIPVIIPRRRRPSWAIMDDGVEY